MKKKVCKSCKIFYEEASCPLCKGTATASSWHGRIAILDIENSKIAKRIGIEKEGEYAIKVR